MKLELHRISVGKLAFGAQTGVSGGVLTINKDELACCCCRTTGFPPSPSTWPTLVKTCASCRSRTPSSPAASWKARAKSSPGWIGDVENAGEGKIALVLGGMAVLTTGRVVAPQEGIVDMSGPGADYTPFSRTCNVVLSFDTAEDLEPHQREACHRIAGLKAAHYLASACRTPPPTAWKPTTSHRWPRPCTSIPACLEVAYMYMLQSQGLLHDTWVYGVDAKHILPDDQPHRTDGTARSSPATASRPCTRTIRMSI